MSKTESMFFMEVEKQKPNKQIHNLSFDSRCNGEKDRVRVYRVVVTVREEALLSEVVKKSLAAK